MLRVEFETPLDGLLASATEAAPTVESVEFDNVVPMGQGRVMVFASVSCSRVTDVAAALGDIQGVSVEHCGPARATDGLYHASFVAGFEGSVLSSVVDTEAVPHRVVATGGRIRGVATVEDWSHLRDLAATIESEHGAFDLRGTTELDRPGYPLGRDKFEYGVRGKLTPGQLEVLQTAYEMGHFAVPQQATSEEVAEALDIGRSTLSERLRRSQNDLLRLLFSDTDG